MNKIIISIFIVLCSYNLSFSKIINLDNIKITIPDSWIIIDSELKNNLKSYLDNNLNNNLNKIISNDILPNYIKKYFDDELKDIINIVKNQNIILACYSKNGIQILITKLNDNTLNDENIFKNNSESLKIANTMIENMYKNIIKNKIKNIIKYYPLIISLIDEKKCLLTSYIYIENGKNIKHDNYYIPYNDYTYKIDFDYPLENKSLYEIINLIKESIKFNK